MQRTLIGAVGGLAIWLSSALIAEAQVIQPTGPMAVHVNDPSEVYTATITWGTSFTYYLQVFVNGTQVYGGQWYITNSGPSYNFQSPVLNTSSWGLTTGATIDFRGTLAVGLSRKAVSDYTLTVQSGGTSMAPRRDSEGMMAATELDRKEWELDGLLGSEAGMMA